jgi:hypothetical protein
MIRRQYTDEEIETLRRLFPDMKTQDLADQLGWTYRQVANTASRYNIRKSENFKKTIWPKFDGTEGLPFRFKKGLIPHNKGKKMNPVVYEKCQATMFKKGNKPHNIKYDGYERISVDGYREVRLRKGKFASLHRLIWEQHNGPIPSGMIVVFKDYNKLNCNIENLMLISRVDNMQRNTIHRYPEELKEIIKINCKLKKRIENGKKQNV